MKRCNLCGFPILRLYKGFFGTRCISCFSTAIHRAIGIALQKLAIDKDKIIYEMSAKGALCRYIRRNYNNAVFSEYFDDIPPGKSFRGIQCQDVQKLTYQDEAFDLVTCTEVFEHVGDDLKGFREIFRVLKIRGYFIFTVPLAGLKNTIERACIRGGRVIHMLPPAYHNDWIRGKNRVLVFRDYGMDIKERLESAGFKSEIEFIKDDTHAVENQAVIICKKQ